MILFFALVGNAIRRRADAQERDARGDGGVGASTEADDELGEATGTNGPTLATRSAPGQEPTPSRAARSQKNRAAFALEKRIQSKEERRPRQPTR